MARLTQGDELWAFTCSWCGRGVRAQDITETLDGSDLCAHCILHYDPGQDEPESVTVFISNIDRE